VISPDEWVPLAEVARPHGVRGELRLKLFNRDSDALLESDEVLVRLPNGEEHEVSVDGARRADQAILLKLHSIDDRSQADEIRGALICVKRDALPSLGDGEFYICDILDARVVVSSGELHGELGTVREVRSYPSVDALVVKTTDGGKDYEIPLVSAFVESVDSVAGLVTLITVDGIERG
jgi:16S rRNA processing protein RimM